MPSAAAGWVDVTALLIPLQSKKKRQRKEAWKEGPLPVAPRKGPKQAPSLRPSQTSSSAAQASAPRITPAGWLDFASLAPTPNLPASPQASAARPRPPTAKQPKPAKQLNVKQPTAKLPTTAKQPTAKAQQVEQARVSKVCRYDLTGESDEESDSDSDSEPTASLIWRKTAEGAATKAKMELNRVAKLQRARRESTRWQTHGEPKEPNVCHQ